MLIPGIVSIVLVICDQLIKWWAKSYLQPVDTIGVIPKVFSLSYVENRGAAWGIFAGNKFLLIGITSIVIIFFIALLVFGKIKHPLLVWAICLISGGGIGNIIDRIFRGYVVDMFKFIPFNFPVFNLADVMVVVGTGLMIIYILFFDNKDKKEKKLEKK